MPCRWSRQLQFVDAVGKGNLSMESGHLSATPMGHIAAKTEDFMCKVMAHHLCFMCKNRRLHVPPPDWGLLIRSSLIHLMAVVFISNLWPLAIRRSNGECLDITGGFHRRLLVHPNRVEVDVGSRLSGGKPCAASFFQFCHPSHASSPISCRRPSEHAAHLPFASEDSTICRK